MTATLVLVQVVSTTWTKRSRGHPGSVARAAVPEGLPIEGRTDRDVDALVETIACKEADGFVVQRREPSSPPPPLTVSNTVIEPVGERLRVTRRPEGSQWPPRRHSRQVFELAPGTSGRLIRNYRYSGYSTEWWYEKVVVNVAWLDHPDPEVFTRAPDIVVDEQERPA